MKEIILDTETTGLSVKEGHRIVEIGCIELDNLVPTKNKFTKKSVKDEIKKILKAIKNERNSSRY